MVNFLVRYCTCCSMLNHLLIVKLNCKIWVTVSRPTKVTFRKRANVIEQLLLGKSSIWRSLHRQFIPYLKLFLVFSLFCCSGSNMYLFEDLPNPGCLPATATECVDKYEENRTMLDPVDRRYETHLIVSNRQKFLPYFF